MRELLKPQSAPKQQGRQHGQKGIRWHCNPAKPNQVRKLWLTNGTKKYVLIEKSVKFGLATAVNVDCDNAICNLGKIRLALTVISLIDIGTD